MVIHRIELCITMVRIAIEFVIAVAEAVVIVQERNSLPLGTLNRTSTPIHFSAFMP
ncbi:hypothetical protein TanjilG_18299 [Lupinus angustifolius]|uniref:Uncharacterized protein n=1 Tax=Lupinus angustifolius TaxID=3871 RepID=A0A1J7G209_LUPAN|nr:hypothetical protein TanjilG_18299 [Lupinus angustifolius]